MVCEASLTFDSKHDSVATCTTQSVVFAVTVPVNSSVSDVNVKKRATEKLAEELPKRSALLKSFQPASTTLTLDDANVIDCFKAYVSAEMSGITIISLYPITPCVTLMIWST